MVQENGFLITYEITVVVTSDNIDDIMAAALKGGINYWCKKAEVVGEYLGEHASDQISRGGVLVLHSAESNHKWTLTRDYLLQGLRLWLANGMDIDHGVCEGCFDSSVVDGTEADCIIQYALFGRVVFG